MECKKVLHSLAGAVGNWRVSWNMRKISSILFMAESLEASTVLGPYQVLNK